MQTRERHRLWVFVYMIIYSQVRANAIADIGKLHEELRFVPISFLPLANTFWSPAQIDKYQCVDSLIQLPEEVDTLKYAGFFYDSIDFQYARIEILWITHLIYRHICFFFLRRRDEGGCLAFKVPYLCVGARKNSMTMMYWKQQPSNIRFSLWVIREAKRMIASFYSLLTDWSFLQHRSYSYEIHGTFI